MHRFTFNLLPEKPKELVVKEEKRESTALFLAILPLFAVLVGTGLMLFNFFIVKQNLTTWENSNKERDTKILGFSQAVVKGLEFIQKTELLAEPVEKDVEPEQFFDLIEELLSKLEFDAEVIKYRRNSDGSFDIVISFKGLDKTGDLIAAFETLNKVKAPSARNINVDLTQGDRIEATINFFVEDDEDLIQ